MKSIQKIILLSFIAILASCSKEPVFEADPFVVAFKDLSEKISETTEVLLIYSETAPEDGEIIIEIATENAVYGRDFITIPEAVGNTLALDIVPGATNNSFEVIELNNAFTDVMEIEFTISEVTITGSSIQGYTSHKISDSAFLGGDFSPTVGGPNEPNQVYIDLSNDQETIVQRDTWDLGFYGGDEFRVGINGSIYMATAPLSTTDMNSVTSETVASMQSSVAVGTFNSENINYIDAPNGDILETAIDEISENDEENPVYLLNLGYEVGTAIPNTGSVAIAGDFRGWKKIRILRDSEDYILQYADLDATSYNEITIAKDSNYNFTFFSFDEEATVAVEPEKLQWDLCFTVFTNVIGDSGSYGFSDYVTHNRKGGVTSYSIVDSEIAFEDFDYTDLDESLLQEAQNTIGDSWRNVFTRTVVDEIYYVLKDNNENYYKIRFLDLVSDSGERGYPRFEFYLLEEDEE